jgi:oxygen-independent coproporphyrinogen-3 oxidase
MTTAISEVNMEVFRRYAGLSLPRHVSYPMPTWWYDLNADQVTEMFTERRERDPRNDLSLYIHVPFCERLCRFCACTRIVLPKTAPKAATRVERYCGALERELGRLAEAAGSDRPVRQIHWGGGSPLYLSDEMIERIHRRLEGLFSIAADAEIAMEIDPRNAAPERLQHLHDLGFNRISLGVQDFDNRVQEHVRRVQPFELVRDTVEAARAAGFESINFDLIYGLPYQTLDTVKDTVQRTIELSPDRVAFYHYAQIPEKIATQRGLDYAKLPDSEAKLAMFLEGVRMFETSGYEFIGLDHLAKSEEGLARALRDGTLQRNFQGMTTGGGLDLLAAGPSSISHLHGIGFLQNVREVEEYCQRVESGETPIHRGKRFTFDDRVRQTALSDLYCLAELRPTELERRFDIIFTEYFARELKVMEELERDGLVALEPDGTIRATWPLGRVLMRNIAAVFDAYLDPEAYRKGEQSCFSANA